MKKKKVEFTEPVTTVFSWTTEPGKEQAFKKAMHEIHKAAKHFPGHMGVTTVQLPPAKNTFLTVLRFDTYQHMHAWLDSPERHELMKPIQKVARVTAEPKSSGLETWFDLPGHAVTAPPKWKMIIITFIALYPISLLFTAFVTPYILHWPLLLRAAVLPAIAPILLTYWIMPFITQKLLRHWLYK